MSHMGFNVQAWPDLQSWQGVSIDVRFDKPCIEPGHGMHIDQVTVPILGTPAGSVMSASHKIVLQH